MNKKAILVFLFFSTTALATEQFENPLRCYGDINYKNGTTSTKYLEFKMKPTGLKSYYQALFTDNYKGRFLLLPSKKVGKRGFYVIHNEGMSWHPFKHKVSSKIKNLHYKVNLPYVDTKVYIDYPDFVTDTGAEYDNINISTKLKPSLGAGYDSIQVKDSFNQDDIKKLHQDLIQKINQGYEAAEDKDQFKSAIRKCKERLNPSFDQDIIIGINRILDRSNIQTRDNTSSSSHQ